MEELAVLEQEVSFHDLGLSDTTLQSITEMGYKVPSPIQAQAIPVVLSGADVVGQAQTGTGKTAAFMLPILEKINPHSRTVQALILCPTRELAVQVHDEAKKFAKNDRNINIVSIYGGQSYDPQIRALKKGVQIVVGTPGRVMDHMKKRTLKLDNLKFMVLDDADEMLNMGFKDDIESILVDTPEERQTVLFSATMPPEILKIARTHQKNPEVIKIAAQELSNRDIEQYYIEVKSKDRMQAMIRCIDAMGIQSSIVFTNTKREVDELVSKLQSEGYVAEGLHGDLKQVQRDRVMHGFRQKKVNILVATDIAARGIDVNNIEAVFNFDIPLNEENYVHRIGRTGRAGESGVSITFVYGRDMFKLRRIENYTKSKMKQMPLPNADDIKKQRVQKFIDELTANIEMTDFSKEHEILGELVDNGHSLVDIAASLLNMQVGGIEKKYAPIEEVTSYDKGGRNERGGDRRGRNDRNDRRGNDRGDRGDRRGRESVPRSNEVRLAFNIGKSKRMSPKDLVSMISKAANVPPRAVGDIDIRPKQTFVNVDKAFAGQIIKRLDSKYIDGTRLTIDKV
jgi:ATP-dependent RNA helicase DeaD